MWIAAVGISGSYSFAEGLQAAHLCFCPASDVIAVPSFPTRTALFANIAKDRVSRDSSRAVFSPELSGSEVVPENWTVGMRG